MAISTSILALACTAAVAASTIHPQTSPHHFSTPGCGNPHNPGYHTHTPTGSNFSIPSALGPRYYTVQVPEPYNANHAYPLIFDYHGNTGTSGSQRNNSAYFNYTQDYLVVYPQGLNRSWQGPSYAVQGVDDLTFTTDLLSHIQDAYCVDPDRVYASGKSNGAGFVDTLACSDAGDAFAAFAMASAALYTDLSLTACGGKKRAILESHGDRDTTIPYHPTKPGSGGPLPDVGEWVHWWGERDCGSDAKPYVDASHEGYNVTSYSCGGQGGGSRVWGKGGERWENVVQHYQIFELGHCWPSSHGWNSDALNQKPRQSCFNVTVLDFTPVVLDFFGKWSLETAPH